MTIEEAYKTLTNPKMSKFECNFKVKNKSSGAKPPKYFLEFQQQMLEFVKRQEQFNKMLLNRIDNLVAKNNLKE